MGILISRLFNYFLLPPGIFLITLIVALIFYFKDKKKLSVILIILTLVMIYLFSIEPVKNMLLLPLENYAEKNGIRYRDFMKHRDANTKLNKGVIVVLGGGIYENSPDFYGKASPHPDAAKRALYAYLLYKKTEMQIITTGGERPGLRESTPEGKALKNMLIKLGVPSYKIIEEDSSLNTYQNILNVKDIMIKHKFRKMYLVTSAYHVKRAMWVCLQLNINAKPVPTDYKINRANLTFESFLPSPLSFYDMRKALHEYLGLLYYKVIY